jgi:hypothetical protein
MKIIGNIKPARPSFYKARASSPVQLADTGIGDVTSEPIDEQACAPLHKLLQASGYAVRISKFNWDEPTLVAVQGSVAPHEDNKLGLIAFWLLYKQPLNKKRENVANQWLVDDPWLFTNQQRRRVKVGDVVLFDADETHAWMCNGGIYAISQTISRKRKP